MDITHFFIGYSFISPGCGSSTSNRLLLWIVSRVLYGDVVDGVCDQIILFSDSVRNIFKSELNITCMAALVCVKDQYR